MRIPESLVPLVDHGVVDEVVRSLKSGKEADVFLVASEGFYRVAKVYKDAQSRSFQNRAAYVEGRQVRNSRDQRAMNKGSRYGRAQNEAAWQSAEVDTIYRLDGAGVRVPKPFHFIDGVLIMEMVSDAEGQPAPRLGEVQFSPEDAKAVFDKLLADVVRMLCAHVVHGDLSEYNVLVGAEGPVIIDFPQSVNAAKNPNARKMLWRDVENLKLFLKRFVPGTPPSRHAEEMWALYERGELTPETQLTGKYEGPQGKPVNTGGVMELIDDARRDHQMKQGHRPQHRGGPRPQHAQSHAHPNRAQQAHAQQDPAHQSHARPQGQHGQAHRPHHDAKPQAAHPPAQPAAPAAHSPSQTQASHPQSHPRTHSPRPHGPHHDRPQHHAQHGQRSQGPHHDGQRPQGPRHDGHRPQAPRHDGQRPQGPRQDGQRPHGSHGHAQRPPGPRHDGQPRPQGQQGHRPQGQHRQGPRRPPAPVVETRPPQLITPSQPPRKS